MGTNDPTREPAQNLRGRCVLIVEDEYFLADDLTKGFANASIDILGPAPSLAKRSPLRSISGSAGRCSTSISMETRSMRWPTR